MAAGFSVDCLYASTNHLRHNFEAKVISAGQTVDVQFTFQPSESRKYHEVVGFEINGLSRQHVDFYGQGTELKVPVRRLLGPEHRAKCTCVSTS